MTAALRDAARAYCESRYGSDSDSLIEYIADLMSEVDLIAPESEEQFVRENDLGALADLDRERSLS